MGNMIQWNAPTADSDWEQTEIYRSTSENGTYILVETQSLPDTSYYDCDGTSGSWYKVKFTSTIGSCSESDLSEALQGVSKNLYTEPNAVLITAGITKETLPDSITTNIIYDWIYEISRNIDRATKTVYGRTQDFLDIFSSGNDLNPQKDLKLPYKNVVVSKVEFRMSLEGDQYNELRPHYDFEAEVGGLLHLYRYPYLGYNKYNDIRVTGSYGLLDVPTEITQLINIMVAIRIFVHITGGSYNDVTSYSLGEFNESLGEPYTNLRATIVMLESEKKRLQEATGISYKRYNMRLA